MGMFSAQEYEGTVVENTRGRNKSQDRMDGESALLAASRKMQVLPVPLDQHKAATQNLRVWAKGLGLTVTVGRTPEGALVIRAVRAVTDEGIALLAEYAKRADKEARAASKPVSAPPAKKTGATPATIAKKTTGRAAQRAA